MKLGIKYSVTDEQLHDIIFKYLAHGGKVVRADDGVLRTGTVIMLNNNSSLYEFVSYEEPINEWSSDQILLKYKKLPRKWERIVDKIEEQINQ